MDNLRIAEELRILANALDLAGENRFKVKAYRTAAESVLELPVQLSEMVATGHDLTKISGIGKGIAAFLSEIIDTGRSSQLETILTKLTPVQRAALSAADRDVKKTVQAMERLEVDTIEKLREKLFDPDNRAKLGRHLERHVRFGIESRDSVLLPVAEDIAANLVEALRSSGHAEQFEIAGQIRRRTETVGVITIVSIGGAFEMLVEACARLPFVESLLERSANRALFAYGGGPRVELFGAESARRGQVMIAATGSTRHVEQIEIALGGKLSDIAEPLGSEEEVYRRAGMPFVEPELREGRGEVEAAKRNSLPRLVSIADLKGDLHCHSDWSDGIDSLESLAEAAASKGYQYLAITDHSSRLKIARGLSVQRLKEQWSAIDELNSRLRGVRLLKSAEVDILADGSLDYPDEVLGELDLTVCSIHSKFELPLEEQTLRVMRAMDNRYFGILGHSTGRLLLSRDGYELDVARVMEHARSRGCFVEINATPNRLDVDDAAAQLAAGLGVKVAISTDAHSVSELDNMVYGVGQARRGWLESADVLNSLPLEGLLAAIRARR